jgi:hypothetical protein
MSYFLWFEFKEWRTTSQACGVQKYISSIYIYIYIKIDKYHTRMIIRWCTYEYWKTKILENIIANALFIKIKVLNSKSIERLKTIDVQIILYILINIYIHYNLSHSLLKLDMSTTVSLHINISTLVMITEYYYTFIFFHNQYI